MAQGAPPPITVTTRKAAAMNAWDVNLTWYAKAVQAMRALPANNPSSWVYQTGIHGYNLSYPVWQTWVGTHAPSPADRQAFWAQCQHSTWYFVSWHRMYLGYFEQIVRKTVVSLGGPAGWALPYWDYDEGANSRRLPFAFWQTTQPGGTPNPLYLANPNRARGNNGQPFIPAQDVNLAPAFNEIPFTGTSTNGGQGFGGPATPFHHGGGAFGLLESLPHNAIHVDIGGLMGDPNTAAYDPIFWLHHANIDRLWVIWRTTLANGRVDPTTPSWLNFQFKFHDANGAVATLQSSAVENTITSPFAYQYDNIAVPPGFPVPPAHPAPPVLLAAMPAPNVPQLAGASTAPVKLTGQPTTLHVGLFPTAKPLLAFAAAESHFRRAHLQVENIRGVGQPGNLDVFLNVPAGGGTPPEKLQVGVISPFGLEDASSASETHTGSGLRQTFDVTEVIDQLKAAGRWDPAKLDVTVVHRDPIPGDASIEIGRVSLYYT